MADDAVSTVDVGARCVARRAVVDAPPHEVFELLADPRRHGELDGSGTVRGTASGPKRLYDGAKFSVNMKQMGVPYRITSTVVAFQEDRLIEWRHPLGHTWRWELADTAAGHTLVTETFDYSAARPAKIYELTGRTNKNGTGITQTLQQLRARFTR